MSQRLGTIGLAVRTSLFLSGLIFLVASAEAREWTVADSIGVRYLSEMQSEPAAINPMKSQAPRDGSGAIVWSPRNRYFFFLSHYGDLGCDCVRYTLTLYDAARLRAVISDSTKRANWSPTPVSEVSFETTSSKDLMAGISSVRWVDDERLLFIGARGRSRQIYQLTATDGQLKQLTHIESADAGKIDDADDSEETGPANFQLAGDTLAYLKARRVRFPPLASVYPAVSLAEARLTNLDSFSSPVVDVYVSRPVGTTPKHVAQCNQNGPRGFLAISPDGRWAISACSYNATRSAQPRDTVARETVQYLLIDIQDGSATPIAGALARGASFKAVWRDDSSAVALLNAFLPQDTSCDSASTLHVVTYSTDTKQAACVVPMSGPSMGGGASVKVSGAAWRDRVKLVVTATRSGKSGSVDIQFRQQAERWMRGPERDTNDSAHRGGKPAQRPVSVDVLMSANEPWRIVATSHGKSIPLTLPDPVLKDVEIVPMMPFEWRVDDREFVAGLYLPSRREPGERLPLVIQVGEYVAERFLPDGMAATAYAAQALVAQRMAVLNLDTFSIRPQGMSSEEDLARRVESVIAKLDAEGIVDPRRVGMIGFSHAGYQVHYFVTHPRAFRLAAGMVADSWTASYGEYTVMEGAVLDASSLRGQTEEKLGGKFWDNKERWLREAPMFNVERVTTPILFTLHNKSLALSAAEAIAAYRINGKPFEYLLFPDGAHQLIRPLERKASMDASVAWMAFWLQGREIPGMQTAETYARWQRAKKLAGKHKAAE